MRHFDLILIGTGSGNTVITQQLDDWSVAIIERDKFGGTCLNVGCIPSKMFEYPAEIADGIRRGPELGVDATLDKVRWADIRDRVFGRIDSIEESGRAYRKGPKTPNITVYEGTARFVGPKTVRIAPNDPGPDSAEETITGDRVIVASGGRPVLPEIAGLDKVPFHTSDSIMRLDDLPASIVIVGGGYIAAEFGHVFASFGTRVTQVVRGGRLLTAQDEEVSAAFTDSVAKRHDLRLHATPIAVRHDGDGITLDLHGPDGDTSVTAEVLLIATGRKPNSDLLDPAAAGIDLHDDGRIRVDEFQRTSAEGVVALGDMSW